jgi:hypothetical protein
MRQDDPPRRSRRGLLRSGIGAAAAASLAGCIATLPPLGRRIRFGRVDVPDLGSPSYRRWLPAEPGFPATEESPDDGLPWLSTSTPGALGEETIGIPFQLFESVKKSRTDYAGVGYGTYDRVVFFGSVLVAAVAVDRGTVRETLAPTGYESAGTHRGFDLYERSDVPRAVAAGDLGLVFSRGAAPLDDVRAVVDARRGRRRRYHEADETFATLSSAAGSPPMTYMHGADDEAAQRANAYAFTFDEDGVYHVQVRVYPPGETPAKHEVKRELEAEADQPVIHPRDARAVDVTVHDRVVTIETRQTHARFREHGSETQLPPQVTLGIDHDRGAGTVTVRHEAGDAVPASQLTVGANATGAAIDAQFGDDHDTVSPGDALTVDVSDWPPDGDPDEALQVTWWRDHQRSYAVLLEYAGWTDAADGESATATGTPIGGSSARNGRAVEMDAVRRGGRE